MKIIPSINGIYKKIDATFEFPCVFALVCEKHFPYCDIFINNMKKNGYQSNSDAKYQIVLSYSNNLKTQSYLLDISKRKISLYAKSEKGFIHGLITIYQMIVTKNGKINESIIEDQPRFKYRGVMLDVVRHFIEIESIKRIIDQMSLLKFNHLHLHLSDDNGYRIESEKYPLLNEISSYRKLSKYDPLVISNKYQEKDIYGGYYKKDELLDLVKYAKERGITIVPEVEIPGHSSSLLAAYSNLSCSNEKIEVKNQFGIFKSVLCLGKEETYDFLTNLLDEIIEIFPSKYIHIGGDEAPAFNWKKCPHCQKEMEIYNLKNTKNLQTHFMNKVAKYLLAKGKIPISWNEILKGDNADENIVIQYWSDLSSENDYKKEKIRNRKKYILSNMNNFYMDQSYPELPLKSSLEYEPEIFHFKISDNMVLGIEAPLWTEWLIEEEQIEKQIYPRLLAISECAWKKDKNYKEFIARVKAFLSFETLNILKPAEEKIYNMKKEEALKETANSIKNMSKRYHIPHEDIDVDNVTLEEHKSSSDNPIQSMTNYLNDKLKYAYSKNDIKKIINIILGGNH